MTLFRRLPAYMINGIAVALGVGLIQLAFGAIAGAHAAQLALSGAVCASIADIPNTPARTWRRVAAAAVLGLVTALAVALLRPYPVSLGVAIALITFVAMMAMAWGVRAGAVSFAPILALIFTMALPAGAVPLPELALWNAGGAVAYLAWALATGAVLERRYRTVILADTLAATAALLRARADLLESPPSDAGASTAMQTWIEGEGALAERLQTTRDFVFAAPGGERARRDIAILLRCVELRDVLLASRLDLDLLGNDAAGRWILERVAQALRRIGAALDGAAHSLNQVQAPAPLAPDALDFAAAFADPPLAQGDSRARLLPAVVDRLHALADDVLRIHALQNGARESVPLTRAQLRRFVTPEGWPLKALKGELAWHSPVLRHALRSALALGSAYFIALGLPWASHPHWLVLSVAVVLRGNLEQTLARRNGRVLGTLLGCVAVLALAAARWAPLLGLVFLASVGIAHSFVLKRYWLTAAAATVMALLQSHMVDPGGGFAIGERAADTLLGALLAWGFSYVLPAWERRALPDAVARLIKELRGYAVLALTLDTGNAVEQRLARRRAYDTVSFLALALKRSGAEPRAVQVPPMEGAALLDHCQRLLAHLSMVRTILAHRGADLGMASAALAGARAALGDCLGDGMPAAATGPPGDPEDLARLPIAAPADDVMPWLERRLALLVHDARQVRAAAGAMLDRLETGAAR